MGIATEATRQGEQEYQSDQKTVAKREKRRAYNRAYYLAHRQERQAYNRQYQQLHRKKRNAKRKRRYRENPTPFLLSTQEWVAKHRDRRKASQKAWYQKHRDRERAKHQAYYHAHREEERAKRRAAYKRKWDAALRALINGL